MQFLYKGISVPHSSDFSHLTNYIGGILLSLCRWYTKPPFLLVFEMISLLYNLWSHFMAWIFITRGFAEIFGKGSMEVLISSLPWVGMAGGDIV